MPSMVKPSTAVTSQAMSAAMAMADLLLHGSGGFFHGGSGAVPVGLVVLVGDADAVAEGELAAEVPGDGERGEAGARQQDRPERHGGLVGAAEQEVERVRGGDGEIERHVQQAGAERGRTRRDGE